MRMAMDPESCTQQNVKINVAAINRRQRIIRVFAIARAFVGEVVRHHDRSVRLTLWQFGPQPCHAGLVPSKRVRGRELAAPANRSELAVSILHDRGNLVRLKSGCFDLPEVVETLLRMDHVLRPRAPAEVLEIGPEAAAHKPEAVDGDNIVFKEVDVEGLGFFAHGVQQLVEVKAVELVVAGNVDHRLVPKAIPRPLESLCADADVTRQDHHVGSLDGLLVNDAIGMFQVDVGHEVDLHCCF